MRLPLAIPMESRDGSTDQDGHLTNAVVEEYEGAFYVAPRPGLSAIGTYAGDAGGLVCFNNNLVALAGTTIYVISNATLFSLNFDSDTTGGSNVSNSGTGGAITLTGSTVSTLHSVSGTKSLNVANSSTAHAASMVFDDIFFAGDYSISFSFYLVSSGLDTDGFFEIVTAIHDTGIGFTEFWKWEIGFNFTDPGVEGFIQCLQQNPVTKYKQWPVSSFTLDDWNTVLITKTGSAYSVTLNGSPLTVGNNDTLTPLASSINSNQMFGGNIESLWGIPIDKLFIDDFIVTSSGALTPSGAMAAGQYDFSVSST